MHAPNHATKVTGPTRRDFYAGVCESDCPFNNVNGWFVPYRLVGKNPDRYEAVIRLFVQDSSSTFLCSMPFLIDTGAHMTIIPRRLVEDGAFQKDKANGPAKVLGISGRPIVGHSFDATLFVPLPRLGPRPLSFGQLEVMVAEDWAEEHALLGLDALRRVLMVSDRDHVSFWSSPMGTCVAD